MTASPLSPDGAHGRTPVAVPSGELSAYVAERLRRDCAEQGVPLTVEDPSVLARVADLMGPREALSRGAA